MAATTALSLVSFLLADWGPPIPVELAMTMMGVAFALIWVNIMVFAMKFETRITNRGIYYKYPPIVWKWKQVTYQELADWRIRKYSIWREFGGPGHKNKLFKKEKGIIINGDQGLELTFKNGKRLLLGTQRPGELKIAIKRAKGEESAESWERRKHLH